MELREQMQRLRRDPALQTTAAILLVIFIAFTFRETPSALRWPVRLLWFGTLGWLLIKTLRTLRSMRFTVKKALFTLIIAAGLYLALAVVCQAFNLVMSKRDDRMAIRGTTRLTEETRADLLRVIEGDGINAFDPLIGWVPRPSLKHKLYRTNTQGMRAEHDYPLKASDEAKRFLCMGDSFTFGVAVDNESTYPSQAEKLLPGTEWLNFGIPGGCLTQAFLHYREHASKFGGKHVILGFMTNDAQRTVNCFRPFLNVDSGCPLPKPFAKLTNGNFSIEPNPIQTIDQLRTLYEHEAEQLPKLLSQDYLTWSGRRDIGGAVMRTFAYIYTTRRIAGNLDALADQHWKIGDAIGSLLPRDPYGDDIWESDSPGFKSICAMMQTFHKQVTDDGRELLIVVIPGPGDVHDFATQRPLVYASFLDFLKANHLPHLDFLDPLVKKHRSELTETALFVDKHYKPAINKELAQEIIKALESLQGP